MQKINLTRREYEELGFKGKEFIEDDMEFILYDNAISCELNGRKVTIYKDDVDLKVQIKYWGF